jgi:hypothetical protein
MKTQLEREYENKVCKKIMSEFPGAMVLKLDSLFIQGIPDRLVLFGDTWASLEIKRYPKAMIQPNQDFYVKKLNNMSYASFLNPANEREVFNDLQRIFGSG